MTGPQREIERSPTDVLRLVVAAVLVLGIVVVDRLFGATLVGFTVDLLRGLDAVPSWMVDAVVIATRVLAVVLLGGLLAWALHGRRWRMLGTVIVAGVAAAVVVTLLEAAVESEQAPALVEVGTDLGRLTSPGFPSTAGIGALAGVLTAAAPWLGRLVVDTINALDLQWPTVSDADRADNERARRELDAEPD